uniref:ATP-binding cassette domain-containing protein n=1 Tax=Collinsella bouchesdurhonensis TaxID=1907654 RepID=UPI00359CAC8A
MDTNPSIDKKTLSVHALTRCAPVAFWLVVWQVASMLDSSGILLCGPLDALLALCRLSSTQTFWSSIWFSTLRIVAGALLGYIIAGVLAAVSWHTSTMRILLQPALLAIKSTPVACVVVILLIWTGAANVSVITVLLLVVPAIYFALCAGLDNMDAGQRDLFEIFGARGRRRFFALIWPAILPYLEAASSTVLGMSWKAGIAAELIGVPAGSLGERIYQAKLLLETPDLFAWTFCVICLSWLFEHGAMALLRGTWPRAAKLALRAPRDLRASGHGSSDASLRAQGLLIGYGAEPLCGPLGFSLGPSSCLCLQAPSGTGKTTLLHTIARLQRPLAGSLENTARGRSMMFQDACLVEDLDAIDNILLFARRGFSRKDARDLACELLPKDALSRPVRELSGGQRRRVELTRAFAAPGELVLLDEPFGGLDAQAHSCALAFVKRHGAGRIVVFATHDANDAQALGAQILEL